MKKLVARCGSGSGCGCGAGVPPALAGIAPALALILLVGCVSISNPFFGGKPNYAKVPADSLKAVALEIEQAIQQGNREPNVQDRDGVVVNTDIVRQAIRMRAARVELLNEFLDSGYGREDNNGLVRILGSKDYTKATTPKQRSRNALLVLNENNDRWAIYEGIVKASKLKGQTATIQDAFHQARLQTMKPGQKFETPDGQTAVK